MRINHISLSVSSLQNSKKFYCENFGFVEYKKFDRPDFGGKALILKLDDTLLELWEVAGHAGNKDDFSDLSILGIKHFGVEVEDVDQEYQKLKSKGLEISEPKTGAVASYCFLKDPDGFPIELMKFI